MLCWVLVGKHIPGMTIGLKPTNIITQGQPTYGLIRAEINMVGKHNDHAFFSNFLWVGLALDCDFRRFQY